MLASVIIDRSCFNISSKSDHFIMIIITQQKINKITCCTLKRNPKSAALRLSSALLNQKFIHTTSCCCCNRHLSLRCGKNRPQSRFRSLAAAQLFFRSSRVRFDAEAFSRLRSIRRIIIAIENVIQTI